MKNTIIVFVIAVLFISASSFGQKQYKRTTTVDEQSAWLKVATPDEIQALIDKCNPNDAARPVLLSLKEEKLRKNQVKIIYKKGTGNKRTVNTGSGNINGNDSTLTVILSLIQELSGKVDGLGDRLDNIDGRLEKLENALVVIDNKIVLLSEKAATIIINQQNATDNSTLQFLSRGTLMLFHSDYLAVTQNDEIVNELARKLSLVLGVRINPLDFEDYRKGNLSGNPKVEMEKILKMVGTVEGSPSVVWQFFVKEADENAAQIRDKYARFK